MPTYLVLAHECIAHKHYVNAENEQEARDRIMSGDFPDTIHSTNRYGDEHSTDTLEWEIVDVEVLPS